MWPTRAQTRSDSLGIYVFSSAVERLDEALKEQFAPNIRIQSFSTHDVS